MWFTKFKANHFLQIYKDIDISLNELNIFIGKNNSGKTRLIELFFWLKNTYNSRHQNFISRINNISSGAQLIPAENKSLPTGEGLRPIRYLSVDRTPASTANFDIHNREPQTQGTSDMLLELRLFPQIRLHVQWEIEHLFGISIRIEDENNNIKLYADDRNISNVGLDAHGRGLQYYCVLFFYLHHPEVKVLFLDEPENSLHPQLQRALINRIRYMAYNNDKQVFLATHSPIFTLPDTIKNLQEVFLLDKHAEPPKILHLEKVIPSDKELKHKFESYLPNLDSAVSEVLFAMGVLIVEGQTERQFIQYIAGRTNRDIAARGITIIESNGLGPMPGMIRFVKEVSPHWRALCDGDVLTNGGSRYNDYRSELNDIFCENTLKTGNNLSPTEKETLKQNLQNKGLFILNQEGLEKYYKSSDAVNYNGEVKHKDKGWLLAKEIEYLQDKDEKSINLYYKDLLEPLDDLIVSVDKNSLKVRTIDEIAMDVIFDHASSIHCKTYRNKFNEQQLRDILFNNRAYRVYGLQFSNYDSYKLYWTVPLVNNETKYRIRCEGNEFYVEVETIKDNDENGYKLLRRGSV
ncbi:MAG: AAA family ATPase [Deltaproteobacteria bacterium]|nr:AAA family ATPase [Deltaproteobacteria bacterium]